MDRGAVHQFGKGLFQHVRLEAVALEILRKLAVNTERRLDGLTFALERFTPDQILFQAAHVLLTANQLGEQIGRVSIQLGDLLFELGEAGGVHRWADEGSLELGETAPGGVVVTAKIGQDLRQPSRLRRVEDRGPDGGGAVDARLAQGGFGAGGALGGSVGGLDGFGAMLVPASPASF